MTTRTPAIPFTTFALFAGVNTLLFAYIGVALYIGDSAYTPQRLVFVPAPAAVTIAPCEITTAQRAEVGETEEEEKARHDQEVRNMLWLMEHPEWRPYGPAKPAGDPK